MAVKTGMRLHLGEDHVGWKRQVLHGSMMVVVTTWRKRVKHGQEEEKVGKNERPFFCVGILGGGEIETGKKKKMEGGVYPWEVGKFTT